jgi:hypothetical protein
MMPDRRRHRGRAPEDEALFAPEQLARLRAAVSDFSWLATRGYSPQAGLELVGDRYQLVSRQRVAVSRVACSEQAKSARGQKRLMASEVRGARLHVDTFNACIGVEVALSGGLSLVGRDGAHRDLASVRGTYRRVLETPGALDLLVDALSEHEPETVTWYLDRPVSNSGSLASMLRDRLARRSLSWEVALVMDADRPVSAPEGVAVSADSAVLDAAEQWFDLAGWIIHERLPEAWVVDLNVETESASRQRLVRDSDESRLGDRDGGPLAE